MLNRLKQKTKHIKTEKYIYLKSCKNYSRISVRFQTEKIKSISHKMGQVEMAQSVAHQSHTVLCTPIQVRVPTNVCQEVSHQWWIWGIHTPIETCLHPPRFETQSKSHRKFKTEVPVVSRKGPMSFKYILKKITWSVYLTVAFIPHTGYIQTELMTCCLGRKHKKLVLFWKTVNSFIYLCFGGLWHNQQFWKIFYLQSL